MSWDTAGRIQALGCPQGPPQTGFGVARTRWSRGGFGSFARQIWLENGKHFTRWILPDPGCPGGSRVRPHGDCVVFWDTVGDIQVFGCQQGPPQTGFGVAEYGPVADLAVLQGKFCLVACTGGLGT